MSRQTTLQSAFCRARSTPSTTAASTDDGTETFDEASGLSLREQGSTWNGCGETLANPEDEGATAGTVLDEHTTAADLLPEEDDIAAGTVLDEHTTAADLHPEEDDIAALLDAEERALFGDSESDASYDVAPTAVALDGSPSELANPSYMPAPPAVDAAAPGGLDADTLCYQNAVAEKPENAP